MDLAAALGLGDRELVSFVGAGGKKTAASHLLAAGERRGVRAAYTTTTHTPPLDGVQTTTVGDRELVDAVAEHDAPMSFVREWVANPSRADRKARGFDPETVSRLFDAGDLDWLVVKADGARRREFKAPGPDEPVIPAASTHVVPVASVEAVGRSLDDSTVHRPDRVADITGLDLGEPITPAAVGAVLASEDGGCKGVPAGTVVTPLVNKADTPELRDTAREIVETALDATDRFDRALVCSFETQSLSVVERQ